MGGAGRGGFQRGAGRRTRIHGIGFITPVHGIDRVMDRQVHEGQAARHKHAAGGIAGRDGRGRGIPVGDDIGAGCGAGQQQG